MDETGSTKALFKKASLDVDPCDEGEILNSSDKFAANNLKLGSAADAVLLLVALETFELGGELGPLRGESWQGAQLGLLLQEPGAVHPLLALPPLLTFTCTREEKKLEITDANFAGYSRPTCNDLSKKGGVDRESEARGQCRANIDTKWRKFTQKETTLSVTVAVDQSLVFTNCFKKMNKFIIQVNFIVVDSFIGT